MKNYKETFTIKCRECEKITEHPFSYEHTLRKFKKLYTTCRCDDCNKDTIQDYIGFAQKVIN